MMAGARVAGGLGLYVRPGGNMTESRSKLTRILRTLRPRSVRVTLIALLLVMIIPHLVVEALHYQGLFEARRAEELQANLELARSVGASFDAYTRDILREEMAIGFALTVFQPQSPERVNRLLSTSTQESPAIRHFGWVGPDGRVVASSDQQAAGMDVRDRPYYAEILAGKESFVSDLFLGHPLNPTELFFLIAHAIRDGNGVLQGIVVASVDPARLDEVLTVQRAEQGAIVLADRQGRAVYRYPEIEMTWEQRNWGTGQPDRPTSPGL